MNILPPLRTVPLLIGMISFSTLSRHIRAAINAHEGMKGLLKQANNVMAAVEKARAGADGPTMVIAEKMVDAAKRESLIDMRKASSDLRIETRRGYPISLMEMLLVFDHTILELQRD